MSPCLLALFQTMAVRYYKGGTVSITTGSITGAGVGIPSGAVSLVTSDTLASGGNVGSLTIRTGAGAAGAFPCPAAIVMVLIIVHWCRWPSRPVAAYRAAPNRKHGGHCPCRRRCNIGRVRLCVSHHR